MKTYKFVVSDGTFRMEIESASSINALNEFIQYHYGNVQYIKNVSISRVS